MRSSNNYTTSLFCVLADPRETRRVDTYLSALFPEKSRSYIQKMIEEGNITANGEHFTKNKKIYRGDIIEMRWKVEAMHLEAEDIPLDIIFENDDFAIINKDAGMNTHPTPGEEWRKGSLVNALLHHFKTLGIRSDEQTQFKEWMMIAKNGESEEDKLFESDESKKEMSEANEFLSPSEPFDTFQLWKVEQDPGAMDRHAVLAMTETKKQETRNKNPSIINWVEKPGIVHRLDKDTSGVIIIAKNDRAMHALQLKIAKRTIEKTYLALVVGKVKDQEGYIESFIGRDPHDRKKMTTLDPVNPKLAKTKFSNKWFFGGKYTLLEVDLLTGRTHQIRVHLSSIGYPIVGDKIYGNEKENKEAEEKYGLARQWLHAWRLNFNLFGQDFHFEWELKDDLKKFL